MAFLDRFKPLAPGSRVPDLTVQDQAGQPHGLTDHAGKPVVLFFYPKDDTPG